MSAYDPKRKSIGKDRSMATILHVEPKQGGTVESELADAIIQFMRSRGDIDRADPEHQLMHFGLIWHGQRHG